MSTGPISGERAFLQQLFFSSTSAAQAAAAAAAAASEGGPARFYISKKQFAHRLAPAYLKGSKITGIDSLSSAQHWISLIDLWLKGDGLFLIPRIKADHLRELQNILKDYAKTLERYQRLSSVDCEAAAKETIQELQQILSRQKVHYTPCGYREGAKNQGHALPFKLTVENSQKVEGCFLNLGEGADMHPLTAQSPSTFKVSYQSFPVSIEKITLFSQRAVDAFTRLIRLQVEPCPSGVRPYSAFDAYSVVYSLGQVRGSFVSPLGKLSKKPQLGDICGDMAITLIVTDVMVDRSYPKEDIQRLICLENLCDILFYYEQLRETGDYDDWTLLRSGISEFATRYLKVSEKILSEQEVEKLYGWLKPITEAADKKISELKKVNVAPLSPDSGIGISTVFKEAAHAEAVTSAFDLKSGRKRSLPLPHAQDHILQPEAILNVLRNWVSNLSALDPALEKEKIHQFVYAAISALPVPDADKEGFWDALPAAHISEVMECLAKLAQSGFKSTMVSRERLAFHNHLILLKSYAIVDRLNRRKYPDRFKNFASPFHPSRLKLIHDSIVGDFLGRTGFEEKVDYFDYDFIPLGRANEHWHQIRLYFETIQSRSDYTLFALESQWYDLEEGVKEFQGWHLPDPWTPLSQHLKFLEPFISLTDEALPMHQRFLELWLNPDHRYLPREIEILYFFAFHSYANFQRKMPAIASTHVPRVRTPLGIQMNVDQGEIKGDHAERCLGSHISYYQVRKTAERDKERTENSSQCIIMHDNLWDLSFTRQWNRIFSDPRMQISSVVHWMRHNWMRISELHVQDLVERGLFQPGLLGEKLSQETALLEQLREIIAKAIDHYEVAPPYFNTLLFFIRLGICCETFSSLPSREALRRYEESLLKFAHLVEHRYILNLYFLFLYQVGLPQEERSLQNLVQASFLVKYSDLTLVPQWLKQEVKSPLQKYQQELVAAIQSPGWREATFQGIFHALLPDLPLPSEPTEGSFPILSNGEYQLDLESATLMRGPAELFFLKMKHRRDTSFEGSSLLWAENGSYVAPDGHIKIERGDNGHVMPARRFPRVEGIDPASWFYQGSVSFKVLEKHALFNSIKCTYWKTTHQVVIYNNWEERPDYLLQVESASTTIRQINPDDTLGWHLLNIWEQEETALFSWLKRLGALHEVLVWVDRKGAIQELEFMRLQLKFQAQEGHFVCENPSGYTLCEDQTVEELNPFKGAIVLEKEGNRFVLIPTRELERLDGDFSSQIFIKEELFDHGFPYYFFSVDRVTGTLIQSNPKANLFLVYLLVLQREYSKAYFYLQRARTFKEQHSIDSYLKHLYELNDQSPAALAFWLKMAIYVIQNKQQLLIENYGKPREISKDGRITYLSQRREPPTTFFKWVSGKYQRYLRIHSIKEVSRVPENLRLNDQEETFLLHHLQPVLENEDEGALTSAMSQLPSSVQFAQGMMKAVAPKPYWREEFDTRMELLHHRKWSYSLTPSTYPLYSDQLVALLWHGVTTIKPDCSLRSSRPYEPRVRFSLHERYLHFMTLFERAKRGEAELDIFYFMRSGEINDAEFSTLIWVLQYVQKYPQDFQDLSFGSIPAQNQKVLAEIVKRVARLTARISENLALMQKIIGGHVTSFHYQISNSYSMPAPPRWKALQWTAVASARTPFTTVYHRVFNEFLTHLIEGTPVSLIPAETPFPLSVPSSSYAHQELHTRLIVGHKAITDPSKGKTAYRLKEDQTAEDCLEKAKCKLISIKEQRKQIKSDVERVANSYPKEAYRLGLRKISGDLPLITLEGILTEAYLKQDLSHIRSANPSLSPTQIYTLMGDTILYHILAIQEYQLERAIAILESTGSIQRFAEEIATYGNFDPLQEPELILYQARTGKKLRKQQAELLEWEIETSHLPIRLFSAPAGDGKSTVYNPIAFKRAHRLGLTPFSTSSRALYRVDREGLKDHAQTLFSFEVAVFELALDTTASVSDWIWVYEEVTQGRNKGFKLTPEVYFALYLKRQSALEAGDFESGWWIKRILRHFKMRVSNYIDESRLNGSPFTQAKMGIGKPIALDGFDAKIIQQIYRLIVTANLSIPDGRTIKEVVRLRENLQSTMEESERQAVKKALLTNLASWSEFGLLDSPQQTELINYWLGQSEEPAWLSRMTPTQKRAIDLVKVYFEEFYESAMKLIWRMQHVRSIKPNEEVHVPARTKQATKAYFDEVYLTLIATIQGTFQEGLTRKQSENLLTELEKFHASQVGHTSQVSAIESRFREWIGNPTVRLNHFSHTPDSLGKFHELVRSNQEAIFWYLEQVVLKQIQYSPYYFCVTPFHFLKAFRNVTLFSAEPGPEEIYGIYTEGKHVRKNQGFLAHAVHQFLKAENREMIFFPVFNRPYEFYKFLITREAHIFSHLRMIADGGMLHKFTTDELIDDFFSFLQDHPKVDLNGIIIFEEASDKEEETKLLLKLRGWRDWKELNGQEVPAAMAEMGLNWAELKLLAFIDPSHRAGANIEPFKNSSILALPGENMTLSDDVQTKLRGRGILRDEQRLIWGMPQKLAPLIAPTVTPEVVLEWEAHNDAKVTDTEVLLSAYQQIDYHVEFPANEELDLAETPAAEGAVWQKYRSGFLRKNDVDPVARFKGKKKMEKTEDLLWRYAEQRYASFHYSLPWARATQLHKELLPIIAAVKRRMELLAATQGVESRKHSSIHTYQREVMKKEYVTSSHFDLKPEAALLLTQETNLSHHLWIEELILQSKKAQEIFGSTRLTSSLFFTENALTTAKSGKTSLKESYLKPIQYLLVVEHLGRWVAFALSDGEAAFFQKELVEKEMREGHIALLSSDGQLVQNGKGRTAFSSAMLNHSFIQDCAIDVGLSQCTLHFPLRFMERISHWEDFWPMWEKMKRGQPLSHNPGIREVEKHVPASLNKSFKPPTKSDNSLMGWLRSFGT